jgi:hypothetical protein
MKEERDEHLAKELKNISYKRIMLSEILKEQGVQNRIREILKDDSKLKKLELTSGPKPAPVDEDTPEEAPEEAQAPSEGKSGQPEEEGS